MTAKTGVELIAAERARQVAKEGWTPEHDDAHRYGELARAAACYAAHASAFERVRDDVDLSVYRGMDAPRRSFGWPWDDDWWKPKDPLHDLVKAGALIAAEIDRLQRKA